MKNNRLCQLAALAKKEGQYSAKTQMMAAATTATEMHFRPLLHRLVEYFYVFLLLILGKDAGSVSVGISQVSIRHYISHEGTTQFQSLRHSMSAKKNLTICCKIIEAENCDSLDDICSSYNGNSTRYYRRKLQKNYNLLCRLEAYRNL